MSDRTIDRLPPWRSLRLITCDLCDQQATRRIHVSGFAVVDSETVTVTHDVVLGAALACEQHRETLLQRYYDEHGGAGSVPLRMSWSYWFLFVFPFTRWLGSLEVTIHNWRFDRACRRAMACPHQWPSDGLGGCELGCGTYRFRFPPSEG